MNVFQNVLVTSIHRPIVVHSQKNRRFQMTNRESFALSLCESGQITYFMNGKQYVSTPDTAVLLPKGATYSLSGDKEGIFYVINFQCKNLSSDEIIVIPLQNPQFYLHQFSAMKKRQFQNGAQLESFSIFYKILHGLSGEGEVMQNRLSPIIQFIEQNLSDPSLGNEALAQELNISEVYLRKLFLKHSSLTPKQYILQMRIQKAKQLLEESPFTVAAIAEKCGFSNPYHFSRTFKQRTGLTPSQYAAQNRFYEI